MTEQVLSYLEALISFDSQNPPRNLDGDHAMYRWLADQVPDFEIEVVDHGEGRVTWFARRGNPRTLFNVHLDTVPVGADWSSNPLQLHLRDGRAYGRGTCDIKGAAACLLDLARTTDLPLGLLFTSDEEGSQGCCVKRFCERLPNPSYDLVVVAEPTSCEVVTEHRGYLSVIGEFAGVAGHSSELRGMADNALHDFASWAGTAVAAVKRDFPDSRFNLGRVEGGVKSNVIADQVSAAFSARLPPGSDSDAFLAAICAQGESELARKPDWRVPFLGPPLPAAGADLQPVKELAATLELPLGDPVGFWTESSLFSEAGLNTFVLGPGHIAQAHAVDEWVAIEQLAKARSLYQRIAEHYV
ncbi:MAG: acetylornithine deacetylase [Pseudomonadota bacterium]